MQILTIAIVCSSNLHVHAKFRLDRMNGFRYMANIKFPKWRPSAILNFTNMRIFTIRTFCNDNLYVAEKFLLGQLHGCGFIKNLIFSLWRRSAIFDLLYACAEPLAMCSSWFLSLYKIWFQSVSSFDNIEV